MFFKNFLQNIYALLIMGLLFTISLALNTIFSDFRDRWIKQNIKNQIYVDIIYFVILIVLLIIFVFLYKGSFNIQKVVLK
jgi:FtsH-binding integral membrane protein